MTTCPGSTFTPFTQLEIRGTSTPKISASLFATGARESSGLSSPSLGLPRCEVTITAAFWSSAWRMPGNEARMRVSSVILPPSIGTLRSARMKTRLPASGTSLMRLKRTALLRVHQRHGGVEHAVGEAPLVVVPGADFHQRALGHAGQASVENCARRVVVEVRGHQRLAGVLEQALQVGLGGLFHRLVDLVDVGRPFRDERKIDERDVDRRHPDRKAI